MVEAKGTVTEEKLISRADPIVSLLTPCLAFSCLVATQRYLACLSIYRSICLPCPVYLNSFRSEGTPTSEKERERRRLHVWQLNSLCFRFTQSTFLFSTRIEFQRREVSIQHSFLSLYASLCVSTEVLFLCIFSHVQRATYAQEAHGDPTRTRMTHTPICLKKLPLLSPIVSALEGTTVPKERWSSCPVAGQDKAPRKKEKKRKRGGRRRQMTTSTYAYVRRHDLEG